MDGHSLPISRQTTERIPERNHDWRVAGACERHLQVSAVFNLSAELAKLICDGIYDLSSHVGKSDAGILANNSWTAQVQELAGDHDEVSAAADWRTFCHNETVFIQRLQPCFRCCSIKCFSLAPTA